MDKKCPSLSSITRFSASCNPKVKKLYITMFETLAKSFATTDVGQIMSVLKKSLPIDLTNDSKRDTIKENVKQRRQHERIKNRRPSHACS